MAFSTFFKATLLAGAVSALAATSAAQGQDNGRYDAAAYAPADEQVIVVAPRYREEGTRLNGVPGHATLSLEVSYADLDLSTGAGARELRGRVRDAARQVCDDLAADSPVTGQATAPCFRTAMNDAMVRANAAIADARY